MNSQRWPKAVEASKPDLYFLIDTIHEEWVQYQASRAAATATLPPHSLLDLCIMLVSQLDALEVDREKWWTSPDSRAKRQRFELEGNQKNLSELHKINNNTIASFESLTAKLGGFVKWGLGMNGGVFELLNAHKVVSGTRTSG